MSDQTWYFIIGGWVFCGIVFLVLAYREIKKADDANEQNDIDWDAFFQESCEHLARRASEPEYAYRTRMKALRPSVKLHQVTELSKPIAPTWPTMKVEQDEAFMLDTEDNQPLAS